MEVEEEDGTISVRNSLIEVSTPEVWFADGFSLHFIILFIYQVHTLHHTPDVAAMIVDDLVLQMKKVIEANPMMPVGKIIFI